ncbi:hypothetical protein PBY51_019754 [Eleginops maclovinus]|uniref:Uncharacterized protein n=1 Tax=Eleginops maclovinus TaxID=56733 RepID=A0AAN7XL50_ELEMC|nr:hypothetical protein PBY51_019754 [Eleginops maclovinus]
MTESMTESPCPGLHVRIRGDSPLPSPCLSLRVRVLHRVRDSPSASEYFCPGLRVQVRVRASASEAMSGSMTESPCQSLYAWVCLFN